MILRRSISSSSLFNKLKSYSTQLPASITARHPLELTIAIVKPHAVAQPFIVEDIQDVLLQEGFITVRSKTIQLTKSDASEFYKEHFGRFFFQRAVELMSSGPIVIKLLARTDAIQRWRKLMGPTKVFRTRLTHSDTLRARFGLTDTRNAVHGSDSTASTVKECKFFFPDFQIDEWYAEKEPLLRLSARSIDADHVTGTDHVIAFPTVKS